MPSLKKEQERIINFNEGNILVSASAGSGKTFVMIERLVRLIIEKKAKVKEILAVTYTESAAKDMKEKLRRALTDKIKETGDPELVEELKDLDFAEVSTLHSFASRLIRRYFFVAGVLPDFSILDEGAASELRADCIDRVFKTLYEKKEEWFYRLVKAYSSGRSDGELKDLVQKIYDFCRVEKDPDFFAESFSAAYDDARFDQTIKILGEYYSSSLKSLIPVAEEALNEFKILKSDKGIDYAAFILEKLYFAAQCADPYAIKDKFSEKISSPFRGRQKEESKFARDMIKSVTDKIEGVAEETANFFNDYNTDKARNAALKRTTEDLVKIAGLFAEEYAKEKSDGNVLDFSDLEHLTLKILKDEDTARAVREKYKYVFADEYQDVNGVQEEILLSLTKDNLFMVGDVKQSIYGFRGCRPEIFARKSAEMKENGERTENLNCNFRSAVSVINMVNEIFSYSMTEDFFGVDYAKDARLQAGGVYPEGAEGRAELHYLRTEKDEKKSETPRIYDVAKENLEAEKETDDISALVAKIVSEELGKEYYDVKAKEFKRVQLKDVAVLTRGKDTKFVSKLVRGLSRRGLSVISGVKENVCEFPEVSALISALKLVDYAKDDLSLAITMLSPVGKFSEQDLAEIVGAGRKETFVKSVENYLNTSEGELKERLEKFFDFLEELRVFADFNGANGVLKKIIRDSGYENYILAGRDGETKLERLNVFLSVSAEGDYSVKEFLKKTELCPDTFEFLRNGNENSLKVMTIHSSKGLEFPVTVLCGLEVNMNVKSEYETVLFDRNAGIAVKYYDFDEKRAFETPYRKLYKKNIAENRIREELRLLYVAATRAEYSLHIVFSGEEDKRGGNVKEAKKFLDYIPPFLKVSVHDAKDYKFFNLGEPPSVTLVGAPDIKRVEELKKRFSFDYAYKTDVSLPLKIDVTSVVEWQKPIFTEKTTVEEIVDREAGIAAHKLLENLDFSALGDFDGQIERLKESGALTEQELLLINAEKIKESLLKNRTDLVSGEVFRERDFIVYAPADLLFGSESGEKVLLQGRIDLLIIHGETATVVDYKYSSLTGESLLKRYKKQLDLYAYAVETALRKKVAAKKIINVLTGESVLTK